MTEFLGIRGEAVEFERNIFPGFTTLEILQKIQDDLQKKNIEPKHFTDRIIFMSMFNDIECTKRNIDETCISNSKKAKLYAKIFSRGHWTFVGPGDDKKWYGAQDTNLIEWSPQHLRWCRNSKRQVTWFSRAPFPSKNVLRHIITGSRKDASVKS